VLQLCSLTPLRPPKIDLLRGQCERMHPQPPVAQMLMNRLAQPAGQLAAFG
jgi:hypothetical protein